MKIKFNERTGRWVPDEPKNYRKIFKTKLENIKNKSMLTFFTCWLWLYLYPYRYIKSDILGLNIKPGFDMALIYAQIHYGNRFAKYKKR